MAVCSGLEVDAHWAARLAREGARHAALMGARGVRSKADASVVTDADLAVEDLVMARIAKRFPRDSRLGEEHGLHEGTSGRIWMVDPIDGTSNFAAGLPLWGTSIGLVQGSRSILGAIHLNASSATLFGWDGGGAWHGRRRLKADPSHLTPTTPVACHFHGREPVLPMLWVLMGCPVKIRALGSVVTAAGELLLGRLGAVVDGGWPWDLAAASCLLKESGFRVAALDPEGRPGRLLPLRPGTREQRFLAGHPNVVRGLLATKPPDA